MIQIGAFDAKTHFSKIIQKVYAGAEYLVTKNGKPVARILPPTINKAQTQESISQILNIRKKYKLSQSGIKQLIKEGRKY